MSRERQAVPPAWENLIVHLREFDAAPDSHHQVWPVIRGDLQKVFHLDPGRIIALAGSSGCDRQRLLAWIIFEGRQFGLVDEAKVAALERRWLQTLYLGASCPWPPEARERPGAGRAPSQ